MPNHIWVIELFDGTSWYVFDMRLTRALARGAKQFLSRAYPNDPVRIRKYVPA